MTLCVTAGSKGLKITTNMTYEEKDVTWREVEQAAHDAVRDHLNKATVTEFCRDWEENVTLVFAMIQDDTYVEHVEYRHLKKTNKNGKVRHIDSPTLVTRIMQYVFINRAAALYETLDNKAALNCKAGCGLNSKTMRLSVRHRVKHLFYDQRDVNYIAVADQRHCYEHVRTKTFRRALKEMGVRGWLVDYACNVTMTDGRLPIGTPVSPLAHHIIMLGFDLAMSASYPFYVRYADNILIGTNSKQEAHAALWRVKQRWWYGMGIRANRWDSRVLPIRGEAVDFCGTVYHRVEGKSYTDHGKGFATVRRSTAESAKAATPQNWPCYFGQLKGADTFNLINSIQEKNMKLSDLTSKVRIDRKMDAKQVFPKDMVGVVMDVLDYEIRQNTRGEDNWIKLLMCMDEIGQDGMPTGKKVVREMHGDLSGLYRYLSLCEKAFGGKRAILPIEEAEIENSCGYIFKGSTNMMMYLEDYVAQMEASEGVTNVAQPVVPVATA